MLTGITNVAQAIADQVGIDTVIADVLLKKRPVPSKTARKQ